MGKHLPKCTCLKCTRAMIRKHMGRHDIWWAIVQNAQLARPGNRHKTIVPFNGRFKRPIPRNTQ